MSEKTIKVQKNTNEYLIIIDKNTQKFSCKLLEFKNAVIEIIIIKGKPIINLFSKAVNFILKYRIENAIINK
jgi:hypothetical protein